LNTRPSPPVSAPVTEPSFHASYCAARRRVTGPPRWQQGGLSARDIFPALLSHIDEAGWNVLGYHCAPGRHADYSPGSPDLDRLVRLMNAINVPDDPGPFSELKTAGSRAFITWKRPRPSPGRS
jgi:hypothetical protein